MEAQFETTDWAPVRIGGVPDMKAEETHLAIEVPGGLSFIAYGDPSATVKGLKEYPNDELPPVAVVHFAFQAMVGIGTLLMGLAVWTAWRVWKQKKTHECFGESRKFLWCVVFSGPLAIIALEAGWIVTEVGRQPWIVHGEMRTVEAVTSSPGILPLFVVTISVYVVLVAGSIATLLHLARVPLPDSPQTNVGESDGT